MAVKKKILITGAAGYVASQMLPSFRKKYELVLLDVGTKNSDGEEVEGVSSVDLIDKDRSAYSHFFEGVNAVIHLAYKRRSGHTLDHSFDENQNVQIA